MIRMFTGLVLVMGAAGGLEMDTASFVQAIGLAFVGLGLMAWPIVDGTVSEKV